jgi:TetR/AcrR family transcriptional repressor of nem operon
MPRPPRNTNSSQRILDVAERLVQTRGFNAFSYADIAAALHVTKASLHYHYPSKSDLGTRLIDRYREAFLAALADIDRTSGTASERLARYVALYAAVLQGNRMCLCGMLAAEFATLPKPMKSALKEFFDQNETWLTQVLASGREAGQLEFGGNPRDIAQLLVSSLEGAMMLARSYGDAARFDHIADRLLHDLAPEHAKPKRKSK